MCNIFISSTGDHAGLSLTALTLSRKLIAREFRVGIVKPFGTNIIHKEGLLIDKDALLFKELLDLEESLETINPFPSLENIAHPDRKFIVENLRTLCTTLAGQKDVIIIMGSGNIFFDNLDSIVPDTKLIMEMDADCILVNRFKEEAASLYSIMSVYSLLRERIKGVIINRVPETIFDKVQKEFVPRLREKDIPVLSVLKEDPVLSSLSLAEVRSLLDGEILTDDVVMEQTIGGMTIGSAHLSGDLNIFKRVYNKIILLVPTSEFGKNGNKPENPKICCILLTGGIKPPSQILTASKKAGIPLMLTGYDTFDALENLERRSSSISIEDEFKVSRFSEMIDHDGTFDGFINSLNGIPDNGQ